MKNRMFLLENSFPQKVRIESKINDFEQEYFYSNSQDFLKEFEKLLAMYSAEDYRILLYIVPPKNRMISFSNIYSKYSLAGWVNFQDFSDIAFYRYDEKKDKEIFEDLFKKFLNEKKDDKIFWQRLFKDEQNTYKPNKFILNDDLALAGDKLLKQAVLDSLDGLTSEVLPTNNLVKYFLTDEQLCFKIAPRYNLKKFFAVDDISQTKQTKIIANIIKAILYLIYMATNNYQDILQIVRDFVWETDSSYDNFEKINEKYQKISEFLQKNQYFLEKKKIWFNDIEQLINEKVDYQMFIFYNLLEEYGVARITKIDLENSCFNIKRM